MASASDGKQTDEREPNGVRYGWEEGVELRVEAVLPFDEIVSGAVVARGRARGSAREENVDRMRP